MTTYFDTFGNKTIFECDFCGTTAKHAEAAEEGWTRVTTFQNVRDFCPDCWKKFGDEFTKRSAIGAYVTYGLVK